MSQRQGTWGSGVYVFQSCVYMWLCPFYMSLPFRAVSWTPVFICLINHWREAKWVGMGCREGLYGMVLWHVIRFGKVTRNQSVLSVVLQISFYGSENWWKKFSLFVGSCKKVLKNLNCLFPTRLKRSAGAFTHTKNTKWGLYHFFFSSFISPKLTI